MSEWHEPRNGTVFVEKWCDWEGEVNRYLLVRSSSRAIEAFLEGRLSMLELLSEPSGGFGFVLDKRGITSLEVRVVLLANLSRAYFPKSDRMHSVDLRPEDWYRAFYSSSSSGESE